MASALALRGPNLIGRVRASGVGDGSERRRTGLSSVRASELQPGSQLPENNVQLPDWIAECIQLAAVDGLSPVPAQSAACPTQQLPRV